MDGWEFGPYRIQSRIARGGMGEVHRAYDTRHDRVVALKLLSAQLAADPVFQERFRRESQVAARLNEPHVVPIHSYGEIDGRLYLDMRLVEGRDLSELLAADGPLPPERAVDVVEQLARALDAAHAANLVHRDIKPSNALMTPQGFVYLVDFGIAGAIAAATRSGGLTGTGGTIGTIDYMAPERLAQRPDVPIDHRVDVYSLACLLYECLTGAKPFLSAEPAGLMYAHVNEPPPRPSSLRPGVPQALDVVVATGMAKHPDGRYSSAGALAAAARAALTAPAVTVAAGAPGPRREATTVLPTGGAQSPDPARRRPAPALLVAAVAAVAALAVVIAVLVGSPGGGGKPGGGRSTSADGGGSSAEPTATGSRKSPRASTGRGRTPSTPAKPSKSQERPSSSAAEPSSSAPASPDRPVGDLGVSRPISSPQCAGGYIVLAGAAVEPGKYRQRVQALLNANPGANYLYAPRSCASLRQRDANGNEIYAVYYGVFGSQGEACGRRVTVGRDAYVKRMDGSTNPNQIIRC